VAHRAIEQRRKTIIRVTEAIVKHQRDFFEKGVQFLKPMILRDIADDEDVKMHESTISRVTTNKYVHTPQGLFELKYFFNSSIRRVAEEDIGPKRSSKPSEVIEGEDKQNRSPIRPSSSFSKKGRDPDRTEDRREYREMLGISRPASGKSRSSPSLVSDYAPITLRLRAAARPAAQPFDATHVERTRRQPNEHRDHVPTPRGE